MTAIKTCQHRHRTPRTLAACLWPGAIFKGGAGDWALVSLCPSRHHPGRFRTVSLHPTRESADAVRDFLDRLACGHACVRRHVVVKIASTR